VDTQQIDLIRASFAHVAPIKREAAALFYGRLFEIAPTLRPLFKGEMEAQGAKLMAMLATAVANLDRLEEIVPAVRALGARHAGYGVQAADYGPVAEALLWTLGHALGDAFTTETRDAWVAAYTILAGQMQDAAAQAAPPPMLKTRLTEEFKLSVPFLNAGMGFVATAPLAAAVCRAGGLGMIGIAAMSPEVLRAQIGEIKQATNRAYGVDIIARFSTPEQIDVLVEQRVPLVVFFWDAPPADWMAQLHAAGSKIFVQVGSVAEAQAALAQGADGLIVQGSEAGGHNRAVAGLLSLLPAVRDIAGDAMVLASGGIADGRTAAAALALGADGVWVGTRLLASHEADAHPEYKARVLAAQVDGTARNNIFGPEFPDATVRGLRNRVVREWLGRDEVAPYKVATPEEMPQIGEADIYGQKVPMTRFCGFPPTSGASGDFEEMSLLAGESVGLTTKMMGAEAIVHEMMREAAAVITGRLAAMVAAPAA
jgi:NAD(P)H-dependent flavin oxidoreductase YrpB (nitropropane dioxygenase family)/hemoglobin-like flavoprotein